MTPARRGALLIRLICFAVLGAWMLLSSRSAFKRLELFASDVELQLAAAPRPSPEVVIVALDEPAVHRYGPLPWPPALMAQTIAAVDRLGPRVIGLDFIYAGEGERRMQAMLHEPAGLEELRQAVARSGKVVAGGFFDFESAEQSPVSALAGQNRHPAASGDGAPPFLEERRIRQLRYLHGASPGLDRLPLPVGAVAHLSAAQISRAAHGFGHLNLLPGEDGTIRWMPLVVRYRDAIYPSFAVELARAYLGDVDAEVLIGEGRVEGLQLGSRLITTDESGRLLVRYAGGAGTYGSVSAAEVLGGQVPAERLRNRIVLIGATAHASGDIWTTPMARFIPGVEVHANAVDNLLQQNFLVHNWRSRVTTYGLLAMLCLLGAWLLPRTRLLGPRRTALIAAISLLALLLGHYWVFTRTGFAVHVVTLLLATAALFAGAVSVNYFSEEKQRKMVERSFAHYLDHKVIAELLEAPERLRLGGERRQLTVLFCDIRNFTTLAEGISPEATVKMLNEFFNHMTGVIFATEGLVDKFVGDQIMAFWGAPLAHADHAARACEAALRMREEFLQLRSRWAHDAPHLREASTGKMQWNINCGLGINTGPMVVGNIGSDRRFSYTVIGDSVNIAARLEALNKTYATQILVGPETRAAAQEGFHFREVDEVQVKGRVQAIAVSELLGRVGDAAPDVEWLADFAGGLRAWRSRDWENAQRGFTAARARNPADAVAAYYLERLKTVEASSAHAPAAKTSTAESHA